MSPEPDRNLTEEELDAAEWLVGTRTLERDVRGLVLLLIEEIRASWADADRSTKDVLVARDECRRLRETIAAARTTVLDAANNDATDEEWARQARAALHVLTLPEAWPSSDAEAVAPSVALVQAAMNMRGALLAQFAHHTLAGDTIEAIEAFDAAASGRQRE